MDRALASGDDLMDEISEQRRRDLETHIQETLGLLKEYEDKRRLSDDPKEKRRCEREIAELRRLLDSYQSAQQAIQEMSGVARGGEIEFVNRENELLLLRVERLRASRSPYTLISAPAGYGKSYLLRHLVHTIESDQTLHEKWFVRYVDLGSSQDPETPLTAIAGDPWITYIVCAIHTSTNQDPRGEPGLLTEPAATTDAVSTYVIQSLSTPLSQGRRAVLLIFDGVERLGETSRQWLYTLMNDLYTRTHSGYQEIITVRVIVAGRNAETFWEGYEQAYPRLPAPRRINLTPFDEYSIQELIWHQAQLAQVSLDDQTVVQIADEVQYLSGGHPKVIRHLADHVAEQSFAIGPAADYFKLHRGELVQTILSPVAQDLLAGLETQTREAVQALSVFRRVNANTVQALIAAEILPPQTNEIDLLGDLQRAHLLESPGIREPFYHDHYAIRRILSLDMAHSCQESRTRYLRLNGIASNSQYGGMV
jgi:hypothetical protein